MQRFIDLLLATATLHIGAAASSSFVSIIPAFKIAPCLVVIFADPIILHLLTQLRNQITTCKHKLKRKHTTSVSARGCLCAGLSRAARSLSCCFSLPGSLVLPKLLQRMPTGLVQRQGRFQALLQESSPTFDIIAKRCTNGLCQIRHVLKLTTHKAWCLQSQSGQSQRDYRSVQLRNVTRCQPCI